MSSISPHASDTWFPGALEDKPAPRECACPACKAILLVPAAFGGKHARCGRCNTLFELPPRLAVPEQAVTEWLLEEDEPPSAGPRVAEPPKAHVGARPQGPGIHKAPAGPAATEAEAPRWEGCRIAKIDRKGVLIEFPAGRLNDVNFRCAMPRRCMQCGCRAHLEAHVIIYASVLVNSVSLEAEHSAGAMVVSSEDARHLAPADFLAKFPLVPNVPPPGNQPMPYWLCDQCSDSGTIAGQITVNSTTGDGHGMLLIGNPRRAEEFLAALGAQQSPDYAELQKHIAQTIETPWDNLSLVVQHRIEQWFKLGAGEQFIAYVPDRDRARTEDGVVGLVVSSGRLVNHSKMRHFEAAHPGPLDLSTKPMAIKNKVQLHMQTPEWEWQMTTDNDGLLQLRQSLGQAKYQVKWTK